MKYLACADLHCSKSEEAYSLSVLEEIAAICREEKTDGLLLGGDIFDSFQDAENMRNLFVGLLEKLPENCRVYYIPGNHEELRAAGTLEKFDFGRARLLAAKPYSLESLDVGLELAAIPFQKNYSAYRSWKVPPKGNKKRIVLAHGTVPGIRGYFQEEENPPGVLDEDLFACLEADLAVVGHIHAGYKKQSGDCLIISPGSARVWREGETGSRRAFLIDSGALGRPGEIILASAGQYRIIGVEAFPDCSLGFPEELETGKGLSPPDWLCLKVSGAVEDETEVMKGINKKIEELKKKYRRITLAKEDLFVLKGISTHPLALQFIKKWEESREKYGGEDEEAYRLAKWRGLAKLKEIAEARK
ncbi:MAG: metallophosphoesterase [Spirochaetales bacterium]|jgi:DNA repair exonuclease SbcCD nuclease subunit|nr:metallophosphoesterase [Spirochaetales bacterium]